MPAAEIIATALEVSIATQMLLFASFLWFGSGVDTAAARALAAVTAIVGLSVVTSLVASIEPLAAVRGLKPPLALLFGPACLIYVSRVRRGGKPLSPVAWLHLIPAIGGAALVVADAGAVIDVYLNLWIGAYWLASCGLVVRYRDEFKPATVRRFVFWLLLIFGLVFVFDVITSYQVQAPGSYRHLPVYLAALLATLLGAAAMMWTALKNPRLLAAPETGLKYAGSGLSRLDLDALGDRFDTLMSDSREYLQENVSLDSVAAKLDTLPRHVSQVVNSRHSMNFSAYVNRQRVLDASRRLRASDDPVTRVMYDVGFGSKSSFNREFKRCFGMSPSQWRLAGESSRAKPSTPDRD